MSRSPNNRNTPIPTWTSLVMETLTLADDFLNLDQLRAAIPKASYNQLTAALSHLQKRHAIESIDSGARLWWFATPSSDDRSKAVEERAPEEPGTRRRGRRTGRFVPPASGPSTPDRLAGTWILAQIRDEDGAQCFAKEGGGTTDVEWLRGIDRQPGAKLGARGKLVYQTGPNRGRLMFIEGEA